MDHKRTSSTARLGKVVAFIGAATIMTTACGQTAGDSAAETQAEEGLKVVVGGSDVGIAALMIPALIKTGEEFDVDVEFKPMAQKVAQTALVSGDIDMGFMSIINLASAQEQGHEVVGVAPTWAANASLVVKADSEFETAQDLIGHPVASLHRTVSVYQEAYFVLEDLGIDMEKDFDLMLADSGGLLQGLLDKGDMDAITQYEPNSTRMMLDGGYREIFHTSKYWQDKGEALRPSQNWSARKAWLDENDSALIQRLASRATEIARTDKQIYADNAEAVNLPAPEGTDLLFERFSPLLLEGYGEENLAAAQDELTDAKGIGLLQKDHDINDLVLGENGGN